MWHEAVAADDIPTAEAKPDFMFTSRFDALSTLLGTTMFVEVKLPGKLNKSISQACAYARRRVASLFEEGLRRNDSAASLHSIFSLAAGTDGVSIVFVRVSSGVPREGSYFGAIPCPTIQSQPLPLLDGFNFELGVWPSSGKPVAAPAGFASLVQVLRAPLGDFSGGQPMQLLNVCLDRSFSSSPPSLTLILTSRLGVGGTSDVYSCVYDGEDCVVKVPRCATTEVKKMYSAETLALTALVEVAGVPRVVAQGVRDFGDDAVRSSVALPWPILVMRPVGVPLLSWLHAQPPESSLLHAADALVSHVLTVLRSAHSKNVFHCDVRPSNIVMVSDATSEAAVPMLVDWGLSRTRGVDVASCGVAQFAASGVFDDDSAPFPSCPLVDLESVAYTWVSIVHGRGAAPWAPTSPELTSSNRDDWLAEHREDTGVEWVNEYVERVRAEAPGVYTWERGGPARA